MKKNILESSNYFLKCDFLNKYRLTNIFEKPSIKKIILYFSLNQLVTSFSLNDRLTPVDAFYLFYSNLSVFSFITFSLISNKKDRVEQFDSNIKIILTKKSDINLFVFKSIRSGKIKQKPNFIIKNFLAPRLCLNFKLPMTSIFNSTNLEFDTENFLRVNLVLNTVSGFKNSRLLLQNSF